MKQNIKYFQKNCFFYLKRTYKKLNIDKVWQVYSSDNWEKDEIIEKKLEKAAKVDEDNQQKIIFESFPSKWQVDFKKSGQMLNTVTLTDIIAYIVIFSHNF